MDDDSIGFGGGLAVVILVVLLMTGSLFILDSILRDLKVNDKDFLFKCFKIEQNLDKCKNFYD